jgi:uncharacterized protein YndB with AHSA1/START domain
MSEPGAQGETWTLVIERDLPHPPEKVWRALTQGPLIEEWLMKNDFEPVVGRKFQFRADPAPNWDGVIACEVRIVEPLRRLAYTWASMGLESVVTFTLTAKGGGAHLRMEQSGFGPGQDFAYRGAEYGWTSFLAKLDETLAKL